METTYINNILTNSNLYSCVSTSQIPATPAEHEKLMLTPSKWKEHSQGLVFKGNFPG